MPKGDGNRHTFSFEVMNADLAYLVGVYMGDGYCDIREGKYGCFRVAVVDTDFLEEVQRIAERVLGFRSAIKLDHKARNENCHDQYILNLCCSQFAVWLEKTTGKKAYIPQEIINGSRDVKLAFVQGIMDSEATISPRRITAENRVVGAPKIIFGVKSEWIYEVKKLCNELGASPSAIYRSKGDILKFQMSPIRYNAAGLTFSIERKRIILECHKDPYPSKKRSYNHPRKKAVANLGNSRLSENDIRQIWSYIGKYTYREIGQMFGVSEWTVLRIANRKTFKHLELEREYRIE